MGEEQALCQNIRASEYYKSLLQISSFNELVDEIYHNVSDSKPFIPKRFSSASRGDGWLRAASGRWRECFGDMLHAQASRCAGAACAPPPRLLPLTHTLITTHNQNPQTREHAPCTRLMRVRAVMGEDG